MPEGINILPARRQKSCGMVPERRAASKRAARSTSRSEKTLATILETAERVFAEKGYAAARLEDVAERVGVRRASIVYYFRDKRSLYEAVLESVFGDLARRYDAVISAPGDPVERLDAVMSTWVSYVGERPAIARLLLREAAEATGEGGTIAARHVAPAVELVTRAIRDGQQTHLFQPIDPIHVIFAVVGATIFFVTAPRTLVPEWPFDPLSPAQLASLRAEVLEITRRLVGARGPLSKTQAA